MNDNDSTTGKRDNFLENFATELTEAVYPVILRHGAVDNWLDLELDLWKALKETVKKWDEDWPSAGVMLVGSLQSANPQPT